MLKILKKYQENSKTYSQDKSDPLTAFVNLQAFVGEEIDGLAGQGGLRWNF
jgi:hypothetical protein